jgi:hypothetical protein
MVMKTKKGLDFALAVTVLFFAGMSWANPTATVDIDLGVEQYPFCGIGWNINAAGIVPEHWLQFKALLDDMQMHYARIIMHMESWQPYEGTFTPNSNNMNNTYQFLDYCEDNNVVAQFHNWWTGGKFDEWVQWPNHYWWLANCCHVDPYNTQGKWESTGWWGTSGPETDYPYSTDKFGHSIYWILDYMVNTKGYTCVKYAGIWNEPSGLWAYNPRDMDGNGYPDFVYPDDTYVLYNKLHWYLETNGLLYDEATGDGIKVVGCDITADSSSDPMDDIGDALSAWDGGHRVDDYMDAISFHAYTTSYWQVCQNARNQIINNNYDGVQEEILVGEIGIYGGPDPGNPQSMVNNSMDCAKKIVGYAKEGAYAIARWWYHHNETLDKTGGWAAAVNFGTTMVPQNFNPMKLYCRSLPKDSVGRYIIQTNTSASIGYFDAVNITYWYKDGNKNTIWVVNDYTTPRDVTVTFSNMGGSYPETIAFEKKYINMDNLDCSIVDGANKIITKTNPQFVDTIPSRCLVAYRQLDNCPIGDLNNDCCVDFQDLFILISHWLEDAR